MGEYNLSQSPLDLFGENMDLTEKYRPKSYREYIGDEKVLKQVEEYVRNDVPVLLHGKPGTGKTTMAYLIAKELGMEVLETNASDERKKEDLKTFGRYFKMRAIVKTLFLFDEVDGMYKSNQKQLAELLKKSNKPIILTANDKMKVDYSLRKHCRFVEVKVTNTHLQSILDRIKHIANKEGIKDVRYKKIKNLDIRSSIKCALENSRGYEEEENNFEKITNIFIENKIENIKSVTPPHSDTTIPWVLDNIPNFYHGLDVYKSITMLSIVANIGDDRLLDCLPISYKGKAKYPYYLRKRSKYANKKYNG